MNRLWEIKQAIEGSIDLLKRARRIAIEESGEDENGPGWPALNVLAGKIDTVVGQAENLLPLPPERY